MHENQALSAKQKHAIAGRRLFLNFFELGFNRAEWLILFPSFQELGNLAISPNHVPHFLFLQETFSFYETWAAD